MICSSLNQLLRTTPPPALTGYGKRRSHIFNGQVFRGQVNLSSHTRKAVVEQSGEKAGCWLWIDLRALHPSERQLANPGGNREQLIMRHVQFWCFKVASEQYNSSIAELKKGIPANEMGVPPALLRNLCNSSYAAGVRVTIKPRSLAFF